MKIGIIKRCVSIYHHAICRLAADTAGQGAARAPFPELRRSLLAWPRAQAALEDAERLR